MNGEFTQDSHFSITHGIIVSARLKSIVGGINSARIRHGDIKPDNLCINSAGEWFVFDFDRSEIVKHPAEEILEDVDTVDDIFHGEFRQGLNYGWT